MSDRPPRSILVVDLRRERAEVLRAVLAPLGLVAVTTDVPAAGAEPPSLAVVDPPPGGLSEHRWRDLRRTLAGVPILHLGKPPVPPAEARIRAFTGPLFPSRLRAAAAALLRVRPRERYGWIQALAACLPIDDEASAVLARAIAARVPVLLHGEPGSGKSLVARALLTRTGSRFERVEVPLAERLADRLRRLPEGSTLYLTNAGALTEEDQADLLAVLDEPTADGLSIICAAPDGSDALAGLRDDLRLHLDVVSLGFRPIRALPDAVPDLFTRTLAALALRYDIEAPGLDPTAHPTLMAHPWPLNFEELVSVATRALFRASAGVILPGDLGLPAAPAAEPVRLPARPAPHARTPRSLEALVQDLGHQIRNPLVSIKTFTQLLPERFEDREFRDEFERVVLRDVERIDGVLQELAQFTRLRDPAIEPTDIAAILRRALDAQHALARKPSSQIVTRNLDRPAIVDTDPELVAFALDSVAREALAALPDSGKLEVAIVTGDGPSGHAHHVVFHFTTGADAGRGARGRRPRPREVLGLRQTLAAQVLEVLGGRLEVEDTAGGATRVTLSFP